MPVFSRRRCSRSRRSNRDAVLYRPTPFSKCRSPCHRAFSHQYQARPSVSAITRHAQPIATGNLSDPGSCPASRQPSQPRACPYLIQGPPTTRFLNNQAPCCQARSITSPHLECDPNATSFSSRTTFIYPTSECFPSQRSDENHDLRHQIFICDSPDRASDRRIAQGEWIGIM